MRAVVVVWNGPGCLKKLKDGFIQPGGEISAGDISEERVAQLMGQGLVSYQDKPEAVKPAAAEPKPPKKKGGSKK
jgi:hypothetical protein